MKTAITDPGEICGTCKKYDPDECYCEIHLSWGEMVEFDLCEDFEEE